MPEMMRLFLKDKVDSGSYGSISEYIRELIRMEQRLELAGQVTASVRPPSRSERSRSEEQDKYGGIFKSVDLNRG